MNAIEQARADRDSMTTKHREALQMDISRDNTIGAQRVDENMQALIRKGIAQHVASGTLVELKCPACGDVSHLRFDSPNVDNWHCFCGDRTPKLMTRTA